MVAVTYGGGSAGSYRAFDAMGRVTAQYQRTDSVNYLTEATYYLDSSLHTEVYPAVPGASDRRTVTYTPDNAGRLGSWSSSSTSYAVAASVSSIGYASHNAINTETYGNSLIHAVSYNNRQQPSEIKLGTSSNSTSVVDINYTYSDSTHVNNGNVLSLSYSGGGLSYTQEFTYDTLNRLSTATEKTGSTTNWSQTNACDRYNNRQIDLGGGSYNLAFSSTTNRITTSGYSYDSSGNLINDGTHSYGFDAESKVAKVDSTTAYVYDGEGNRVKKLVGESTRFIYGIGGKLVAEYDSSTGNLKKEYLAGGITIEPTAVNSNGTQYPTADHLGSPRVMTNSSGSVVSRHDYKPFGEELGASVGGRTTGMGFSNGGDTNRKQFTGYERDSETGLDFAQARYYASAAGRFTSPDPFSASAIIADPQTFNRYQYCRNNPVNSTDPSGMAAMGAMSPPSGERVNVINAMNEQRHAEVAEQEAQWEQMVKLAFMGVQQNESVTVFITEAAQGQSAPYTNDNPDSISTNSKDCRITILFKQGTSFNDEPNKPNGASSISAEGKEEGVGFTVSVQVPSGGIGRMGSETNLANPGGVWTIQQFRWNYTKMNGVVVQNDLKAVDELSFGVPNVVSGNMAVYYDHPGIPTEGTPGLPLSSAHGRWDFAVKAVNGIKQCEVEFHTRSVFGSDGWTHSWGKGLSRR